MKEKIKDVAVRALKTFWQAALASAILNSETLFTNLTELDAEKVKTLLITVCMAALAAGLSAVYNGVLRPIVDKLTTKE